MKTRRAAPAWLGYWKDLDLWTAQEFAALCCGTDPENPGQSKAFAAQVERVLDIIRRAVEACTIPHVSIHEHRFMEHESQFRPGEVAEWAKRKFPATFPFSADDFRTSMKDAVTDQSRRRPNLDSNRWHFPRY